MSSVTGSIVSLSFPLEVEDGWPPVVVECLPLRIVNEGYAVLVPPLFVKDLSVGDVIEAKLEPGDQVRSWLHAARSGRTTIWLLRMRCSSTIEVVLAKLRAVGCNTASLEAAGAYSVDVPEAVAIETVDVVLSELDSEAVAVAFPSMRHVELEGQ